MDSWVGGVPSTLHQRISIWCPDDIVENIEADQSYFMVDVNHVGIKNFGKNLGKIPTCYPTETSYTPQKDAFSFLNLHATHGFIWD